MKHPVVDNPVERERGGEGERGGGREGGREGGEGGNSR